MAIYLLIRLDQGLGPEFGQKQLQCDPDLDSLIHSFIHSAVTQNLPGFYVTEASLTSKNREMRN